MCIIFIFSSDTPAVLSLGKLYTEHDYTHEWPSGSESRLTENGNQTFCRTENFVSLAVPRLSSVLPQLLPQHHLRRIHLFHWNQQICEVTRNLQSTATQELRESAFPNWLVLWNANIFTFLQKIGQDSTNVVRKSCQEYSSGSAFVVGESGKVIFWLQTMRSWGKLDPSEIHTRRLRLFLEKFTFRNGKITWKRSFKNLRINSEIVKLQRMKISTKNFKRNSDETQPAETKEDAEVRDDFWMIEEEFISVCRKNEPFPQPLKCVALLNNSHNLDVMQEKLVVDCWNVVGDGTLSDSWTGFLKFTKKPFANVGRQLLNLL